MKTQERLEKASELMDAFAIRTGLTDKGGNSFVRYLWTDALAVCNFLGLAKRLHKKAYLDLALRLVDEVHDKLGKFRQDDYREGWISGLSESQGKIHPTIGGLRIGKALRERAMDEPLDHKMEWDRDGQYFHYLTRWIYTLLRVGEETEDAKFYIWAAELAQTAARAFLVGKEEELTIYWKMDSVLSRPLVTGMGTHDPLEGFLIFLNIQQKISQTNIDLSSEISDLIKICQRCEWITIDPLGIGGLLLNLVNACKLSHEQILPEKVSVGRLLEDSYLSLKNYTLIEGVSKITDQNLAFRDCGLSLGLNSISWIKHYNNNEDNIDLINAIESYTIIANKIENYWLNPQNRNFLSWQKHLDINAISLAASLIPEGVFGEINN